MAGRRGGRNEVDIKRWRSKRRTDKGGRVNRVAQLRSQSVDNESER